MLLQKEKQSIEEIGKKDKKIYERRKVSLSNIYDLLFPQKSRKYFRTNAKEHIGEVSSVKVSFCTSFRGKIKKGSLAVETALVLPLFFLGMVTLISFMDIYKGTVWTIYSRRNVPEVLMCVGTGFLFVLISILTEGAVGMGDGWLLMALGTVLYPEEFFSTLFMGMICSAVWSGIMMMGFCRKGSTEIPFVPFLLAGYLGGFLI